MCYDNVSFTTSSHQYKNQTNCKRKYKKKSAHFEVEFWDYYFHHIALRNFKYIPWGTVSKGKNSILVAENENARENGPFTETFKSTHILPKSKTKQQKKSNISILVNL